MKAARVLFIAGVAILIVQAYAGIATRVAPHTQEAGVVGSTLQIHQLEIALELYYLEHHTYPRVASSDLGETLFEAGFLKQNGQMTYEYRVSKDGQDYTLR